VVDCAVANGIGTRTVIDGAYGPCTMTGCNAGFDDCDGVSTNGCEVGLQNDGSNCGACGHACPGVANGIGSCTLGACGVASCDAGFVQSSGACIPVVKECVVDNGAGTQTWSGSAYGTCNVSSCDAEFSMMDNSCVPTVVACPLPNAIATRTFAGAGYGPCVLSRCVPGYADCDGVSADGCEVAIQSDANHCGSCGHVCQAGAIGVAACAAGVCL
jgi:hypothetical protein